MPAIEVAVAVFSLIVGALIPLVERVARETAKGQSVLEWIQNRQTLMKFLEDIGFRVREPIPATERVQQLLQKFDEVTTETDLIIQELARNIDARATVVRELEREEEDLKQRIKGLKVQPEGAAASLEAHLEVLIRLQEKQERRSALRDYTLYVLGVMTPYAITFALRRLGVEL